MDKAMEITTALALLAGGEHEKYPVASAADCQITEQAIGSPLPASYRKFVMEFSNGAYLYTLQEVSAVGAGNRQIAPIQSIIAEIRERGANEPIAFREGGQTTAGNLVPFSLDPNANAWCFVLEPGATSEPPVAYFDTAGRRLYGRLESFAGWLGILAERRNEVIRTLYNDAVIEGELGLG